MTNQEVFCRSSQFLDLKFSCFFGRAGADKEDGAEGHEAGGDGESAGGGDGTPEDTDDHLGKAGHHVGDAFDHSQNDCRNSEYGQKAWHDHRCRLVTKITQCAGNPCTNDSTIPPFFRTGWLFVFWLLFRLRWSRQRLAFNEALLIVQNLDPRHQVQHFTANLGGAFVVSLGFMLGIVSNFGVFIANRDTKVATGH